MVRWYALRRNWSHAGWHRGIVVGSCIEYFFAQIAQMVVMGGEDIATVVALASHLCNDVEALVVLQELIVDICFYALHAFDGFGCHPYDGLVYHLLAVGFEKFNWCLPCVDQSGIVALASLL